MRSPGAAALLLGGVLLWEMALRTQMGVAVSFLEELWSRNLGHVFVSPLRPWELVRALLGISLVRMLSASARDTAGLGCSTRLTCSRSDR